MGGGHMSDSSCQTVNHILSPQFLVACAVYEITEIDETKAYFPTIVEKLESLMTREQVRKGLEFMWSWRVVMRQLEPIEDKYRFRYYITSEDYKNIKDIYDNYYHTSHTTIKGDEE